jgi:Bacterial antitoxin of ParD toxin-antitoxin type II system and RHH
LEENEAILQALRAALMEGEQSGPSTPLALIALDVGRSIDIPKALGGTVRRHCGTACRLVR